MSDCYFPIKWKFIFFLFFACNSYFFLGLISPITLLRFRTWHLVSPTRLHAELDSAQVVGVKVVSRQVKKKKKNGDFEQSIKIKVSFNIR